MIAKSYFGFLLGFVLGSCWMWLTGDILRMKTRALISNSTFSKTSFSSESHKAKQSLGPTYQDSGSNRVIIYTLHRSGSTFTAELFARHPDVYYVYEPFQMFPFSVPKKQETVNKIGEASLRSIFQCDAKPLLNKIKSLYGLKGVKRIKGFGIRSFCDKVNLGMNLTSRIKICQSSRDLATEMKKMCVKKADIVVKLVTLENFTSLVPLMHQGVKVIHLVRDPRGQINSIRRVSSSLDGYQRKPVKDLATKICAVLRAGLSESANILRNDPIVQENFRRVRYEDIAQNPEDYIDKLYTFSGLKWNGNAKAWVKSMYNATHRQNHPYTIAWAWRSRMSYAYIGNLMPKCADVMDALGYIKTNSETHLRRKTDSLHGTPRDKTAWL